MQENESFLGIFFLIVVIFYVVTAWKIYAKAGRPGWASIIPFYNMYVGLQIIGRPIWWIILFFIPYVNIAISLVTAIDLAKAFGRSTTFGVFGLWLFSFIGYPILAFGDAKYVSPKSRTESVSQKTSVKKTPVLKKTVLKKKSAPKKK